MDAKGNQIAMTPEQIEQATQQLIQNVQSRATESGQAIDMAQGQLGPSLQNASNLEGGYNYQRFMQPTVDPLVASLVTDARQATLRQGLTDAAWRAQENYTAEKMAYDQRYREFQREQAKRQRERQRRADAQAAQIAQSQIAALRAGGNPSGGRVNINPSGARAVPNGNPGGYNFFDSNGKPITAAQYANLTKIPLVQIIEGMANEGNTGAQAIMSTRSNMVGTGVNAFNLTPQQRRQWSYVFGGV